MISFLTAEQKLSELRILFQVKKKKKIKKEATKDGEGENFLKVLAMTVQLRAGKASPNGICPMSAEKLWKIRVEV